MKFSMMYETCRPIAYGRRSKIFALDDSSVAKIYKKGFPVDEIQGEYDKTLAVHISTALPVPEPLRLLEENGYYGIVYRKVEGCSCMDLMMENPLRTSKLLDKIAEIHRNIHDNEVDIIDQETYFGPLIQSSNRLLEKDKKRVGEALRKLAIPNPKLCHGDFHQGNILINENSYVILDWMDAFSGNPLLDVALTAVNASVSSTPSHIPKFWGVGYEILSNILPLDRMYVRRYGKSEKDLEIQRALFVAAAIHLVRCKDERIEKQRRYLDVKLQEQL